MDNKFKSILYAQYNIDRCCKSEVDRLLNWLCLYIVKDFVILLLLFFQKFQVRMNYYDIEEFLINIFD